MARVSIGLPVYNGERYLEEAIESLCRQTYSDLELIISDNASSDRTGEICRRAAKRDRRIRYVRQERNLGAAWNYNRVFALASGEIFKWAAHDDLAAPQLVERCVAALDADPGAVLAYPQTIIIDANGRQVKHYRDDLDLNLSLPIERLQRYLFRKGEECNAVFGLIRSSALRQTRLIEPYNASDRVLLANLALLGRFREVPEELFFRRDHPQTSRRANRNARAVAAWFDSQHSRRIVLPVCRLYLETARCVLRADLGAGEHCRGLLQVARRFWWNRQAVYQEFGALPRDLLASVKIGAPSREGER